MADTRDANPVEWDFRDLLPRARAGDEDAARRLYALYTPHILREVRRRLPRRLRSLFDSDDFVQMTWESIFTMPDLQVFESPERFLKYLFGVVCNKVREQRRNYLDIGKRDLRRQVSLDAAVGQGQEPIDRRPMPEVLAMDADEWERLVARVPQPHRWLLEELRAGWRCARS